MGRPVLLDSSFLIALEHESTVSQPGPARRFLPALGGRRLVVSVVTVAELLEGAIDEAAALAALQRFLILGYIWLKPSAVPGCSGARRVVSARTMHGS